MKRISLLLAVCMLLSVFMTACQVTPPDNSKTEETTTVKEETSIEETTEKNAVSETETTDGTGDEETTTSDEETYDVSSVEKALEAASKTQSKVTGGALSLQKGEYLNENVSFAFGNGYLKTVTTTDDYEKTVHATLGKDGKVCYVIMNPGDYLAPVTIDTDAKDNCMNGPAIDLANFIGENAEVFGAYELVDFFYYLYPSTVQETDITETVADGVYTFTYSMEGSAAVYGTATYTVTVSFTLDKDGYFINKLDVKIESVETSGSETAMLTYTQSDDEALRIKEASKYGIDNIVPTSFSFQNASGEKIDFINGVAGTIDAYVAEYDGIKIVVLEPETGLVAALGTVTPAIKDKNGNAVDASRAHAYYRASDDKIIVLVYDEGEYHVNIKLGEDTYIIPINATWKKPTAEDFTPVYFERPEGVILEEWLPITALDCYTGQPIMLRAELAEGCKPDAFGAVIKNNAVGATLTQSFDLDYTYDGKNDLIYTFKASEAGNYTVVLTSAANSAVTKEIKLNVIKAPELSELTEGKWTYEYTDNWGATTNMSINFYPADDISGIAVVDYSVSRYGGSADSYKIIYKYEIKDGEIITTWLKETHTTVSVTENGNTDSVTADSSEYKTAGILVTNAYKLEFDGIRLTQVSKTPDETDPEDFEDVTEPEKETDENGEEIIELGGGAMEEWGIIDIKKVGSYKYKTTVPADTRYFYNILSPGYEDMAWDGRWSISISFEGNATVEVKSLRFAEPLKAPYDDLPFNTDDYLYGFEITNSTAAEVTVFISVTVKEQSGDDKPPIEVTTEPITEPIESTEPEEVTTEPEEERLLTSTINDAQAAQGYVTGGSVSIQTDYVNDVTSFAYGNGYLRSSTVTVDGTKTAHATLNPDGTVCYVFFDPLNTMQPVSVKTAAGAEYMDGPAINLENYTGENVSVCGAVGLLKYFHGQFAKGVEMTETAENGIYSFVYSVTKKGAYSYLDADYTITASFTLKQGSSFVEQLTLTILKEGMYSSSETTTITYNQIDDASLVIVEDSQYGLGDIMPTKLNILDINGDELSFTNNVSNPINIPVTTNNTISLEVVSPTNGLIEALGRIAPVMKDADGNTVAGSKSYVYYENGNVLISFYSEGEYYLNIPIGETTYIIPFHVGYKVPTSDDLAPIYKSGVDDYDVPTWDPAKNMSCYTDQTIVFGVKFGEGCLKDQYTLTIKNGVSGATLTSAKEDADFDGNTDQVYKFKATVAGTYTLVFTSTVDPSVTKEITLTVTQKPDLSAVASGKWSATSTDRLGDTTHIELIFSPASSSSGTFAINVRVETAASTTAEYHIEYSYVIASNKLTATWVSETDGTGAESTVYQSATVSVNDYYEVVFDGIVLEKTSA